MGYSQLDTVCIGGFNTILADCEELASWMGNVCADLRSQPDPKTPVLIFSSNGQGIALAGKDAYYDAAMAAANVIHADGMPVVMASRLLTRTPIRGRSSTTDLFHDVAGVAQTQGLSFFILGSSEEQNANAVRQMQRLYPELKIVGRRNGYFSEEEDAEVCAQIVASGADILWVGLGKPKQEIWCHRNRKALAGVGCIKTCGGLYGFLTGDEQRAPNWMQKAGFEWFYRLVNNPRRLFWRYLVTNSLATYRLLRYTGRPLHKRSVE